MSRLKSLGAWLRASPLRPFAAVGVLLAFNILSASLLPNAAAAVVSGVILVAVVVLAVAYVMGGRS